MPKLQPITLHGKYTDLVPLAIDHAPALAALANDSRTTFSLTDVPHDIESAKKFVQRAHELHERNLILPFATIDKATGQVVGTTRFLDVQFWSYPIGHELAKPENIPHVVEIGGTWIGERYQRTGINTDAKISMLTYAFETWKVLRVSLKTDARNQRSRTNIERVGAKFDGILRAHMPSYDGGIRDTAYYSIVADEWPNVKARLQSRLR
ncbi:MAG: GNAT family protein [Bdellovibrionota bacterium]